MWKNIFDEIKISRNLLNHSKFGTSEKGGSVRWSSMVEEH
jgi:hypothetical protein